MRRKVRFRLQPGEQPEFIGEDFDWRSSADDAYFLLTPTTKYFPDGWIHIKSTLRAPAEIKTLKLYYDDGFGFSEKNSRMLPVAPPGVIDELIVMPPGISAMRWQLCGGLGDVSRRSLVITKVGLFARLAIRLRRFILACRHGDPQKRKDLGVTFRNLLWRPQDTYQAAGNIQVRSWESDYRKWLTKCRLTAADRQAIFSHIQRFKARPLISVLMPVYNTPVELLKKSISSVQSQLYPDWELCAVDDASSNPEVKAVLAEAAASDRRIRLRYRATNGHISAASNDALGMARGDYIALLDHDDVLSEQAFYQIVVELNRHSDTDIVYTDEDKIFSDNADAREHQHGDPHFKSDWNPDLLYSQNYVSHLGVYRTELVRQVGGFREGFEGSQDYDLLLRCITKTKNIRHIPAVLYHWRASSASTASSSLEKSYASDRGIRALQDHFRSIGLDAVEVEHGHFPTTYHVKFPIPVPAPKVSIIIPMRDRHRLLRRCVESVQGKTTYPNYEIVIVDNQTEEPASLDYLAALVASGVARVLRYDHQFNYSALNNWAVGQVDGDVIALLNNDTEVISPNWLTEMTSHAVRPEVGAVGAKLYYPDETIQHAGVITGLGGVAGHSHKHCQRHDPGYFRRLFLTQNFSAVTGACLVVRRDNFLRVGGFDSENLAIAFSDVDFCLKLTELGLRNVWTPYAQLYHHESVSRGPESSPEKARRFQQEIGWMKKRWGDRLLSDPYYSPRLTLDREDFGPDYRRFPPKPWLNAD